MLTEKNLPAEFVKLCRTIAAKRPKTVIDHLVKHGQITTEELKNRYGYNHPPRAVRDVKEQGSCERERMAANPVHSARSTPLNYRFQ